MAVIRHAIRVIPQSSRQKISMMSNGVLKVTLTEPPVSGKANEALLRILAYYYDVPIDHVRIVRGHTNNNKLIEIKKER